LLFENEPKKDDPYNYLAQYNNFFKNDKVISLKYPYTENSIREAFFKLNISIKSMITVCPRTRNYTLTDYNKPNVKKGIKYYKDSPLEDIGLWKSLATAACRG
jgi:hypothetical protein